MSLTYARVLIESDDNGRISINAEDARGVGHGYRIAGPKYCGCHPGKKTASRVLTARDVEEIRRYLAIWDGLPTADGPDPAALFDTPQVTTDTAGRHWHDGHEYDAVTVDGELTYTPKPTEG